ncbi:copper chaperone CopZ [mine drainage metagenome]|uniref:Copper chaperone CopZ n=1 Tax=mine drainage metagenome TaxID=410659 RepID=A0A1J5T866_9ZZZZ
MQTVTLKIIGMTCGGCVNSVTNVLKAIPGVKDATVTLTPGQASIQYDEQLTLPKQLTLAIQDAGYDAELA